VQNLTPAVREAAAQRKIEPGRLARLLRGDLDWITLKAVEKDRTRRYETAAALARDLEHYLHHEPVSAVAPTWHYALGKFARRHRGALIAASLVVAALLAGIVVSLWQASVARKNRREADHRYEQARDAVNKYLSTVTEDPKLKQDNFENLRRDLLETALPFFEDMRHAKGDDAQLRSDRAWATAKLGMLYRDLGRMEQAEATLHEALDLHLKLAAQFPQALSRQVQITHAQAALAATLYTEGKMEPALAEYDESIKIREALVARVPDNREYRQWLAAALVNRGTVLGELHRHEEAIAALDKASVIQEKLVAQFPGDKEIRRSLAANYLAKGNALRRTARPAEAIPVFRKALALYDQLTKEIPNDHNILQNRVTVQVGLGQAFHALGRWEEAESLIRSGVAQCRALVDKFPTSLDHQHGLIGAQQVLMVALKEEKKWPEFDRLQSELRKELERLAAQSPGDAWISQMLAAVIDEAKDRAAPESRPSLPAKETTPAKSPRKFTLDYKYEDPGPRYWVLEGNTWMETQPSGKQNTFVVVGSGEVDGIRGTEIERTGSWKLRLFVPDFGAEAPMRLRMKNGAGRWVSVGPIRNVE